MKGTINRHQTSELMDQYKDKNLYQIHLLLENKERRNLKNLLPIIIVNKKKMMEIWVKEVMMKLKKMIIRLPMIIWRMAHLEINRIIINSLKIHKKTYK
jgi:hypothetical protein